MVKKNPVTAFFLLCFLITGTSALLTRFMVEGVIPRWELMPKFTAYGPTIAGLVMTVLLYGSSGIRELLFRSRRWKVAWPWLLTCIFLPVCVLFLAVGIRAAVGHEIPSIQWHTWPDAAVRILGCAFLGAGVSEEFGWRGFALEHLQRKWTALESSLIIGVVWAFWHFPPPFIMGQTREWTELASYIPGVVAMSVVLTVVFNATNGSLVAVILLHGANNASWRIIKDDLFPELVLGGVAEENLLVGGVWIVITVALTMILGPENLSRHRRISVSHALQPESDLNMPTPSDVSRTEAGG